MNRIGALNKLINVIVLNFLSPWSALLKTGVIVPIVPAAMMSMVREPSSTLILSNRAGSVNFATMADRVVAATTKPKNQIKSDLIFPNSSRVLNIVRYLVNTVAAIVIGRAMVVANCVNGKTAPSSSCGTYFGTSHSPITALMTSPKRSATNIRMEYHQKSPRRVCNLAMNDFKVQVLYHSAGLIADIGCDKIQIDEFGGVRKGCLCRRR